MPSGTLSSPNADDHPHRLAAAAGAEAVARPPRRAGGGQSQPNQSESRGQGLSQSQAEQILKSRFYKNDLELFENVRLEFRQGRIIQATANHTQRLNEILDTDAGARYVGEFSLGFNPYIQNPMCDILFDEKIAG